MTFKKATACRSEILDFFMPLFEFHVSLGTFDVNKNSEKHLAFGSSCLTTVERIHYFRGQLKAKPISYLFFFFCRKTVLSVGRAPQVDRNTPLNGLFMAVRILGDRMSKVHEV